MMILAFDPGAVTGWVMYDTSTRTVYRHGHFPGSDWDTIYPPADVHIIERPKGYGATYPQVVDAAWHGGRIAQRFGIDDDHTLTRREVCLALTDAVQNTVRVKNDATAWAALVLLHGEGSDRKPKRKAGKVIDAGGALGTVTSHARAALAVAVAWDWIQQGKENKR